MLTREKCLHVLHRYKIFSLKIYLIYSWLASYMEDWLAVASAGLALQVFISCMKIPDSTIACTLPLSYRETHIVSPVLHYQQLSGNFLSVSQKSSGKVAPLGYGITYMGSKKFKSIWRQRWIIRPLRCDMILKRAFPWNGVSKPQKMCWIFDECVN